ncbi:unnamed protein product [Heligmosomoides polygyrus]|uniref:SET domain-containing protein n=1 Tax=Heligmosomoides polygyrus TaxID=6339 RepID=A0A183FVE9_HELPZ|nr:unnamed protein product [Heligmosomoides polygyrus]
MEINDENASGVRRGRATGSSDENSMDFEGEAQVGDILSESRMAKEKRAEAEKEVAEKVQMIKVRLAEIEKTVNLPVDLVKEIRCALEQRGIETVEEWRSYVRTMERDGEILAGSERAEIARYGTEGRGGRRSMGVQMGKGKDKFPPNDLVGERMVVPARVLGSKEKALLGTRSMISIVPVEMLARARDRKVDVDSFKFVEKSKLTTVHDASGNRMDFLGAVYLAVNLEGGGSGVVAFHISANKEEELIIGTNAMSESEHDNSGSDAEDKQREPQYHPPQQQQPQQQQQNHREQQPNPLSHAASTSWE